MPYKRKRIALLFCGGTTLDERDRSGDSVKRAADMPRWMDQLGEVQMVAQVDPFFVYGGAGVDVGPEQWQQLAETIGSEYSRYDGFLVLHGLDSIAYTAAALAFTLQNLNKPVVLTGSTLRTQEERRCSLGGVEPSGRKGASARANFMNALQVATSELPEVAVVFGNRIFRGTQVIRNPLGSATPFDSYDGRPLGKIDFGIQLSTEVLIRGRSAFRLAAKIDANVRQVDLLPGADFAALDQWITQRVHGLFIVADKGISFPAPLLTLLSRAKRARIPIAVYVPRHDRRAAASPYLVIDQMSRPAAAVKFMWARGQTANPRRLQALLNCNIAGEITADREVRGMV